MKNALEETPKKIEIKSEVNVEKPPRSFDGKSKKSLYEKIRVKLIQSPDDLKLFLMEAVTKLHKFPIAMQKRLDCLYTAYDQFSGNSMVQQELQNTMVIYIKTEGFETFKTLFDKSFDENDWSSGFLIFLAKKLDLSLEEQPPMVEAVIHYGKTYWRIIQDNKILYERQQENPCSQNVWMNSWKMHWKKFEFYKHGGKRSSTVKITKERFINSFQEKHEEKIEEIWKELKEKGILNSKDRLSEEWRALSGATIILSSLGCCDILSKTSFKPTKEDLKTLPGKSRHAYVFTKKNLYYVNKDKNSFEKIDIDSYALDTLKENIKIPAVETKLNLIYESLLFSCQKSSPTKFSSELKLIKKVSGHVLQEISEEYSYKSIAEKLFAITNCQKYKDEGIEKFFQKEFIFRPELNKKSWSETGYIENKDGKTAEHCSELWHVGIYGDLNAHRNSEIEEKENEKLLKKNMILNYDHIPSKAALKLLKEEEGEQLESKKIKLEKIKKEILLSKDKNFQQKIEKLKEEENKISNEISNLEFSQTQMEREAIKKGIHWWTIAIPKKLHKDGNTDMKSKKEQKKSTEHPFLADIKVHIENLEAQAEKNQLPVDEYIKALGALRYLYHRQTKPPSLINGQYSTGFASHQFFKDPKELKKIDDLLNVSIKRFIAKIEGQHLTDENVSICIEF